MKKLAIFLLLIYSNFSFAALIGSSEMVIRHIVFFTNEYTEYPNSAGGILMRFESPIQWQGTTNCVTTDIAIKAGNDHLISAAIAAHASKAKVRVFVDDTADDNEVHCKMTLLIVE